MREIMEKLKQRAQSLVPPITEGLRVEDVSIETFDDSTIQLRIYTPTTGDTSNKKRDCIV